MQSSRGIHPSRPRPLVGDVKSRPEGMGRQKSWPPLSPAFRKAFLLSLAGDSFQRAFRLCAGNRLLPLSLEESGAKNRPFLMLNCVRADGCFGQCDPPRRAHSQPGFRRLTPAPFVARYRALALKKRPPKEKRKKHSLAAKRHQFLKVGTGIV